MIYDAIALYMYVYIYVHIHVCSEWDGFKVLVSSEKFHSKFISIERYSTGVPGYHVPQEPVPGTPGIFCTGIYLYTEIQFSNT
jgi:hypothetical protein